MNNCSTCGMPIKTVPAGISKKTGNPYDSFQTCSNNECPSKKPKPKSKPVPPGLAMPKAELANDTQLSMISAKLDKIILLMERASKVAGFWVGEKEAKPNATNITPSIAEINKIFDSSEIVSTDEA